MTMHNAAIAAIVFCASLTSTWALAAAEAALLRTAQSDQAPASVQDVNPSRAEPMMMGPTQEQDAEAYRRDYLACESLAGDRREACRDAVDRQYRPEVTNLSGECDALDAAAKAQCLKRTGSESR
jgi:hypothetical protein